MARVTTAFYLASVQPNPARAPVSSRHHPSLSPWTLSSIPSPIRIINATRVNYVWVRLIFLYFSQKHEGAKTGGAPTAGSLNADTGPPSPDRLTVNTACGACRNV